MKKIILPIIVVGIAIVSFYFGMVWEAVTSSTERENEYPWDLARTQFDNPISCQNYKSFNQIGNFHYDILQDGKVVRLVTYNNNKKEFTVTFIDDNHRVANENWNEECE